MRIQIAAMGLARRAGLAAVATCTAMPHRHACRPVQCSNPLLHAGPAAYHNTPLAYVTGPAHPQPHPERQHSFAHCTQPLTCVRDEVQGCEARLAPAAHEHQDGLGGAVHLGEGTTGGGRAGNGGGFRGKVLPGPATCSSPRKFAPVWLRTRACSWTPCAGSRTCRGSPGCGTPGAPAARWA